MTGRSLAPLPSRTWITIRSLSISAIFKLTVSGAHSPAAQAVLLAGPYISWT